MVSASHRRSEGSGLITAWESEMFKELHYNNESLPCSLKTASSRQLFTGRTSSLRDAHAQQISCLKNLFFPRFFFKNLYDFSLTDFLSSFFPSKVGREVKQRDCSQICSKEVLHSSLLSSRPSVIPTDAPCNARPPLALSMTSLSTSSLNSSSLAST